jgi:hypothetical protein
MSITGIVENDTIKLPVHIPDGTKVEIIVTEENTEAVMPGFLREVLAVAKPQDWPADYALNHAHYTKGEPPR